MNYYQKKNKNEISINIEESSITYSLRDESIKKTDKIPFESILTSQYEIFESNKSFKNNAIYTGVVGSLFLLINIFYEAKLWAWMFMLASPIFYFLYYKSKAAYTVIKTADNINLLVLRDKKHDEIIEQIYINRNTYLRDNYLHIDYDNEAKAELSKFAWLNEQGIISDKEFVVIQEEIEENLR